MLLFEHYQWGFQDRLSSVCLSLPLWLRNTILPEPRDLSNYYGYKSKHPGLNETQPIRAPREYHFHPWRIKKYPRIRVKWLACKRKKKKIRKCLFIPNQDPLEIDDTNLAVAYFRGIHYILPELNQPTGHINFKILWKMWGSYLLSLHHPIAGWRHTVHAHVGGAMTVANGDRESTEICPDYFYCLIRGTGNSQSFSFTLVCCFVSGAVWTDAWNRKTE